MRKNSIKNTRINMEVQRELANIIRGGIKDPRISPMTTVVAVEVAPDLKTAKAYISVLGDKEAQENTLKGLKSAEGYIRRELARSVNLRNTPEIHFIMDQSIAYGVSMSKLIDDVNKNIPNREEDGEDDSLHFGDLGWLSYGYDFYGDWYCGDCHRYFRLLYDPGCAH